MDRFQLLALMLVICLVVFNESNKLKPTPIEIPKPPNIVVIKPQPIEILDLITIPKYRNIEESSVYGEVLNYSKGHPFGDKDGRPTNVHETAHGISAEIKNDHFKKYTYPIEGLYYGDGKGVILKHPNITIKDIAEYIPEKLRSYRFKTYFIHQTKDWNHKPLYILNEWVAYIWGAKCAVEDHQKLNLHTKEDSVSGALEFSLYTIGLCLTVKDKDPEFWSSNKQFKLAIKDYLQRAEKVFFEGKDIFPSPKQKVLLESLKSMPPTDPIKEMLITDFDSLFVRKL